jgi:predicted nucleic acid-binding protein
MCMALADTSVWIAFFNGNDAKAVDQLDDALALNDVIMGDLILTEILQGFRSDLDFATARQLLSTLPIVHLGGAKICLQAAANYRQLRRLGVTARKTFDAVIATYCIETALPLLHSDRDFDAFEKHLGLAVVR